MSTPSWSAPFLSVPDEDRRSVTFEEFRQVCRRQRPSDVLPALAAFACRMGEPPYGLRVLSTTPPWAIALAARESILWGNEHRRAGVTDNDLRILFNAHNDIHEQREVMGDNLVHAVLTRILYEQFLYGESIFEEVSRAHALLIAGPPDVDTEVLTPSAWEEILGAPLGETVGATFFLQVAASQNAGWYHPAWLDGPGFEPIFEKWPRSVIEDRAEQLSSTFDQFKAAYEAAPKPEGLNRYSFNPLHARPFIRMPDGRLLAPQPRLILRTVTPANLYYPGIKKYGQAFGRDLGRLTEHYVGEQLRTIDTATVVPEIIWGKEVKKSTDWFIVFPNLVVLVEVKSARFNLLHRAADDGFEEALQTLLNEALKQLARTTGELDNQNPAFAHIPADRPRVNLIVTAEPYYLANSPWVRDTLNEPVSPTITASLRDLEHLVSFPGDTVETELARIANDPERSTWNLNNALRGITGRHRNKILDKAWKSYPWPSALRDSDEDE